MSDINLYDKVNYDNWPISTSWSEYASSDFGIDFQNGFKIPTNFVKNVMFSYLKPISSKYSASRKTKSEINIYNTQKTQWGIEIRGRITGTDRANLIENIEYFKIKVRNRMNIVIKDAGVEKIAKCFVEDIDWDENHYNHTFMNFVVTLSFRDYLSHNESTNLQYLWITDTVKTMNFYNNGLETDFVGVIEVNAGTGLTFTLNVNGVDLIIPGINSWDTITIQTEWPNNAPDVNVNGSSIVFWGIVTKLEEGDNTLIMTRLGAWDYDFNIFYKKTIW